MPEVRLYRKVPRLKLQCRLTYKTGYERDTPQGIPIPIELRGNSRSASMTHRLPPEMPQPQFIEEWVLEESNLCLCVLFPLRSLSLSDTSHPLLSSPTPPWVSWTIDNIAPFLNSSSCTCVKSICVMSICVMSICM